MTTLGGHPDRLDLTVHAGQPVDFTIPILDAAGAAVTTLSGWTAAAQIRATADGPILHTFTATIDDDDLTVRVTVTPADTAAWTWTVGQWDLVLTSSVSVPHVLCAGWVRVYPTITH